MSPPPEEERAPVTAGDDAAPGGDSFPAVYDELRGLAARYLRRQRPDHTLQPTALVHEAFMRLIQHRQPGGIGGADLMRLAARAMRTVLVDHARRKTARKRKAEGGRVPLDEAFDPSLEIAPARELIAIDKALDRLAELEPQWRLIIELRFFAGCSEDEIAGLLQISPRTVQRQWRMAKAWLRHEITEEKPDDE